MRPDAAQRGCPARQVAESARHSVAVLLKVYAKCVDGQDQIAKRRIEDALCDPGEPERDGPQKSEEGDALSRVSSR
jgi:hypothetical protein